MCVCANDTGAFQVSLEASAVDGENVPLESGLMNISGLKRNIALKRRRQGVRRLGYTWHTGR